jgi:crossover junction endodeoxyribonuclease RuvC
VEVGLLASRQVVHIAGIDLSLSNSGVTVWREGQEPRTTNVKSSPTKNPSLGDRVLRSQTIAVRVIRSAIAGKQDGDLALFVIEGPAYASDVGKMWDRAGVWTLVLNGLSRHGLLAEVPPSTLKQFVTGSGSADKALMVSTLFKQFPSLPLLDDNAADSLGLAWMGARHLNTDPVLRNPRARLEALDKVRWPLPERR